MRYEARAPLRIDFAGGWTDVPFYAEEKGGAVLNAAITRYVTGHVSRPDVSGLLKAIRSDKSYVAYSLELPSGAGLGSSAAQNVLWLAMLKTSLSNTADRAEIADMACRLANLLGILGGKQDEYASALGGIHFFSFDAGVRADRIHLPLPFLEELRSRLVLVYSGTSRISSSIHERVWERYRDGDARVIEALGGLKRVAEVMRRTLIAQNLDDLASLMSENWSYQKELDESVTSTDLDDLFDFARRHGARGGKACGAGGGGCCVFVAEAGRAASLRSAFRSRRLSLVDFDFDTYGVFVRKG
ncbi:MAG TPA: GHMP kinase [Chloroflexota bacterium]